MNVSVIQFELYPGGSKPFYSQEYECDHGQHHLQATVRKNQEWSQGQEKKRAAKKWYHCNDSASWV